MPEAIRDSGGAIEAEATISGTVSNPRATLVAQRTGLRRPWRRADRLDATVEVDRRAVFVSPLTARRDGTEASGDVSIDLTLESLGGTIHVTVPDAMALQADVPEQWRVYRAPWTPK